MSGARFVPAALLPAVVGAAGSVWFMYLVGARQRSGLLILMFTVWVLSPFVGLVAADHRWKDRAPPFRATLHVVTLLVALGSLAVYGEVALGPPRLKPARFFLMVPLPALDGVAEQRAEHAGSVERVAHHDPGDTPQIVEEHAAGAGVSRRPPDVDDGPISAPRTEQTTPGTPPRGG